MNKLRKSIVPIALLTLMMLLAPLSASAASGLQPINGAVLNDQVHFEMESLAVVPTADDGSVVLPITYKGTTYLPVRAMSYLLGIGIGYDASKQTVMLTSTSDRTVQAPTSANQGKTNQLLPIDGTVLNGKISFTIDGVNVVLAGADGSPVLPITYRGTTYLPLRALGQLFIMDIHYDNDTKKISLSKDHRTTPPTTPIKSDDSTTPGTDSSEIVSITIPAIFHFGATAEEVKVSAIEAGFLDVIENEDDSFTYSILKKEYASFIQNAKDQILTWADDAVAEIDSIKKITINDAFTEMTIYVDREQYFNNWDGLNLIEVSFLALNLHLFNQVEVGDFEFTQYIIDDLTGEVLDISPTEFTK